MLARLWWKELRLLWPLMAAIALAAAGLQWLLISYAARDVQTGVLTPMALGWAAIYAFAAGAAAFAGEREGRTMLFLDTLPVDRTTLWLGKTSFSLVTTAALATLLVALAATGTTARDVETFGYAIVLLGGGAIVLEALAWSLFWSSLTSNALIAAILAVGTVGPMAVVASYDATTFVRSAPWGMAFAGAAAALSLVAVAGKSWKAGRSPARKPGPSVKSPANTEWDSQRPSALWRIATIRVFEFDPAGFLTRFIPVRTVRSLIWQASRMARMSRGVLLSVAGLMLILSVTEADAILATGLGVFASLVIGVDVFGAENRAGAYPFLVHHGVRPRLVWLTKVPGGMFWLAILAVLARVSFVPRYRASDPGVAWTAVAMFMAFAIGQLCGMIIRRGITAWVASIPALVAVLFAHAGLWKLGLIPFWSVFLMPCLMLLATWAWSDDWMSDRPGSGRWVRLGLLLSAVVAIPATSYIVYRAWGVPDIGPLADPSTLRRPPLPAWQDAAPVYRRAFAAIQRTASSAGGVAGGVEPRAGGPEITEGIDHHVQRLRPEEARWVRANRSAIAVAREAAAMPHADFATSESPNPLAPLPDTVLRVRDLSGLIVLDLRDREPRGDLAGALKDIRVLQRMAGHVAEAPCPSLRRLIAGGILREAIEREILWASDPRQTPALLRSALADVRRSTHLPPVARSIVVDEARDETWLNGSAEELSEIFIRGEGSYPSHERFLHALPTAILVAPWERVRAKRVLRILTASILEAAGRGSSSPFGPADSEGSTSTARPWPRSPADWDVLAIRNSSPLAKLLEGGSGSLFYAETQELVHARALELILALRVWQLEHGGRYPEALGALVPSVLDRLPVDPYSGHPFGYLRSHGQRLLPPGAGIQRDVFSPDKMSRPTRPGDWLLYSVGPDGRDDRAERDFDASKPFDTLKSSGDYVYPLPGRAEGRDE